MVFKIPSTSPVDELIRVQQSSSKYTDLPLIGFNDEGILTTAVNGPVVLQHGLISHTSLSKLVVGVTVLEGV